MKLEKCLSKDEVLAAAENVYAAQAGVVMVFAWKGETLLEYWQCIEQTITVDGPNACAHLYR